MTSLLTVTSNVVYDEATGNAPDRRRVGRPLASGVNLNYQDGKFLGEKSGLSASLDSATRLEYTTTLDGIPNTQTINPNGLGRDDGIRVNNSRNILDGHFDKDDHHLNVNVFTDELLLDAQAHPEKCPNLTIRVSGCVVKFRDLTPEQQADVISRTPHNRL